MGGSELRMSRSACVLAFFIEERGNSGSEDEVLLHGTEMPIPKFMTSVDEFAQAPVPTPYRCQLV